MNDRNKEPRSDYWLSLARQDLMGAHSLLADVSLEPRLSVGLAAQAAEKALKAALAATGVEPPRTHDLVALAHRSRGVVRLIAREIDLRRLSDSHQNARYPDHGEAYYHREEATELVRVADLVVTDVTIALGAT